MTDSDFTPLAELPDLDERLREHLAGHGVVTCEQLYALLAGDAAEHPALRDVAGTTVEELLLACAERIAPDTREAIDAEASADWLDRRPPGVEPPPESEASS